jgi:hypothetical protein
MTEMMRVTIMIVLNIYFSTARMLSSIQSAM